MRKEKDLPRAEYIIRGRRDVLAVRNFAVDVLGMSIRKARRVEPGAEVEERRKDHKVVAINWEIPKKVTLNL